MVKRATCSAGTGQFRMRADDLLGIVAPRCDARARNAPSCGAEPLPQLRVAHEIDDPVGELRPRCLARSRRPGVVVA
jgi:hypothetical protein